MTARFRPLALLVGLLALTLGVSACHFNGAYDLPLPGGPVSSGNSYTVTAEFTDILNVVPKSPVMVDDVTVGEVTAIKRVGWHAEVTMRIRKDIVLPDNAIAQIRQVSLLGEKYVDLEKPVTQQPEGRLQDGDNIPLSRTGQNPEVEDVLSALSDLLSGGGVAQLGTITQELNQVMDGRTERLRDLFSNLNGVIGTLNGQKSEILEALSSLDSLSRTLNGEKSTITNALDATGPAIRVLSDQEHQLVTMLASLDRLGTVGTRVIRASKRNLLSQLRSLQPVLSHLNAAGQKLAPGLNLLVSFPFPKEASEIVQGDYANTEIVADFDLSTLVPSTTAMNAVKQPLKPQQLTTLQRCLASGSLTSAVCRTITSSLTLLTHLITACHGQAAQRQHRGVCGAVNLLRSGKGVGGTGGKGGGPGGILGGILGGLATGLSNGLPSGRPSTRTLLGGQP